MGDHRCLSNTQIFLVYCVKIALTKLPVCLCRTTLQDGRERMNLLSYAIILGGFVCLIWFGFGFFLFFV